MRLKLRYTEGTMSLSSSYEKIRVVAAVVSHQGTYLITQRRPSARFPLQWEFPGGKVEIGESDEEALARELKERLNADFKIGKKIGERVHKYQNHQVTFVLYSAFLEENQKLEAKRVHDFRYIPPVEFGLYDFIDADQEMMEQHLQLK